MMNIKPGTILISAPLLEDPYFDKAVIYLAEINPYGALGFVINNLYPRVLNELVEFKQSKAFPLYEGGPVKTESIFLIHRRPDLIEAGSCITEPVYLGGNIQQAVQHINDGSISEKEIKLFLGYCGWDYGELEDEVAEGSWLVLNSKDLNVFDLPITTLWEECYEWWKKG